MLPILMKFIVYIANRPVVLRAKLKRKHFLLRPKISFDFEIKDLKRSFIFSAFLENGVYINTDFISFFIGCCKLVLQEPVTLYAKGWCWPILQSSSHPLTKKRLRHSICSYWGAIVRSSSECCVVFYIAQKPKANADSTVSLAARKYHQCKPGTPDSYRMRSTNINHYVILAQQRKDDTFIVHPLAYQWMMKLK